jgi:ribosome-associated protein
MIIPPKKRITKMPVKTNTKTAVQIEASDRSNALHKLITATLSDRKAEHIVTINLAKKADFADAMIIASGTSARHVAALAEHVVDALKEQGVVSMVEGLDTGDWVLVDAGDVIVHLFKPEVREYYKLEKMWGVPALISEAAVS